MSETEFFRWGKLWGSLILSLLTLFVQAAEGLRGWDLTARFVAAAIVSYLVIALLSYAGNLVLTPAILDEETATELAALQSAPGEKLRTQTAAISDLKTQGLEILHGVGGQMPVEMWKGELAQWTKGTYEYLNTCSPHAAVTFADVSSRLASSYAGVPEELQNDYGALVHRVKNLSTILGNPSAYLG